MSLSNLNLHPQYRFPFVRPKLPSLDRVSVEFDRSRAANYYSNFGPTSLVFEAEIQKYYFPHLAVVACANCTVGLSAALIAARIEGPVLIPAFTFPATFSAVRGAGLTAVVADVDSRTGLLDPQAAEAAILAHDCAAMIVVRPYGIWSDLSPLAALCARHGVKLIIDNAAGIGVEPEIIARHALPEAVELFSLHATKPFGVGEGGLCVMPTAEKHNLRSALNFGLWSLGELVPGEGINGKMDELTAAMALVVLRDLPQRIGERQAVAAGFNARAHDAGLDTFVAPGDEHLAPWQCFPIKLPPEVSIDTLVHECAHEGLQARRYYWPPLASRQSSAPTPNAQALSERVICLPIYDGPDAQDADAIWSIFAAALAKN